MAAPDLIVIGAGPWGLAAAWRAAARGARVTLLDDRRRPAAWVAAGMLGPWSEAADGEDDLHRLQVTAAGRWPAFAAELQRASGVDPGYLVGGTVMVAARPEDIGSVRHHMERLRRLGHDAPWTPGSALREQEPGLAPGVAGGIVLEDEAQVDPRRLLAALHAACRAAGVDVRADAAGSLRRDGGGRVNGVALASGGKLRGARVVLAAGHSASRLSGRVPLRPVLGQALRLRLPRDARPPARRVVRTPSAYVVPRPGGELVVGATVEERSDAAPTAGGAHELLDDALAALPDLRELELVEVAAGLRPATPDGAPAIGVDPDDGLLWAVGGYRHGILLAPVAAEAVAELAAGDPAPELAAFSPTRFAAQEAPCA